MNKYTHEQLMKIMADANASTDAMQHMKQHPEAHLQIMATEYVTRLLKGEPPQDLVPHLLTVLDSAFERLARVQKQLDRVDMQLKGLLEPHQ